MNIHSANSGRVFEDATNMWTQQCGSNRWKHTLWATKVHIAMQDMAFEICIAQYDTLDGPISPPKSVWRSCKWMCKNMQMQHTRRSECEYSAVQYNATKFKDWNLQAPPCSCKASWTSFYLKISIHCDWHKCNNIIIQFA